MTRRQRIRAYGSAVGLMVVGVICGFAVPGLVGDIIRLSLITLGLGAVLLLVFYEIGLSEDEAHELVLQTIWGAAKMLRQGTAQPSALRRAVTSKGGTTEAALAVFAQGDLSGGQGEYAVWSD